MTTKCPNCGESLRLVHVTRATRAVTAEALAPLVLQWLREQPGRAARVRDVMRRWRVSSEKCEAVLEVIALGDHAGDFEYRGRTRWFVLRGAASEAASEAAKL